MNQLRTLLCTVFFIVITGCSATGQVTTAYQAQADDKFSYDFLNSEKVTPKAMPIFKEHLESQLKERGIFADASNVNVKEVIIQFNNYRMRDGAARAIAGIFAGTDNINTTVIIKSSGKIVGEYEVESSNASAWGTSRGLIHKHIEKIVNYLKKSVE